MSSWIGNTDIDRENRCKQLESFADPFLAMLVVVLGQGIDTAEKRPAHAPRDTMIDTDLVGRHDLRACVGGHGRSLQRVLKVSGSNVRKTTSEQKYRFLIALVNALLSKMLRAPRSMVFPAARG